jgi:hypothetical protein
LPFIFTEAELILRQAQDDRFFKERAFFSKLLSMYLVEASRSFRPADVEADYSARAARWRRPAQLARAGPHASGFSLVPKLHLGTSSVSAKFHFALTGLSDDGIGNGIASARAFPNGVWE